MENVNLFIIRMVLASVILNAVVSKKAKETGIVHKSEAIENVQKDLENVQKDRDFYLKPKLNSKHVKNKRRKDTKKPKVSKRDAYSSWSDRSENYGYGEYSGNLPLYLVFNRKVGAYYPFYKYPKENLVRRNWNARRPSQPVRPVK